ncbi:MAG: TolC family outer membrane protein [Pseudomonadota bacterium]
MSIRQTIHRFADGERVFWHTFTLIVSTCLVASMASSAHAETLREALLSAYRKNPQLDAERSNLRATDEDVAIARSNYRPSIGLSGDVSAQKQNTSPDITSGDRTTYPAGYSLSLNQQVLSGTRGHTVNLTEANLRAGRETLRSTEQTILLNAVTAYMNVVRDTAIVELRENNVRVLSRDLKATQDRFSVGEVTRTDVAQSRARRSQSVSDLELARANLKSSRANYEQVIGHPPGSLSEPEPPYSILPKTLPEATRRAELENPNVLTAFHVEQARYHDVKANAGQLLPTFDVDATYSNRYSGGGDLSTTQTETGTVTGTLRVPLYQRGLVSAEVRQAKQQHIRAMQLLEQERNEAREAAISAWAQLTASRAQLNSTQSQVEASRIALSGVREEEEVGQRTLLDVLDAEQELLDSQVLLISNRRDLVVNAYTVLSTVGGLTAEGLRLTAQPYDAEANYNAIKRKWYGISITHSNGKREYFQAKDTAGK